MIIVITISNTNTSNQMGSFKYVIEYNPPKKANTYNIKIILIDCHFFIRMTPIID